MIFPPASAFVDSSSWNNTNLLQQPASFSVITPSAAAAAGEGNLLQHGSAMVAVSHPLRGGSGIGGDGGAPAQPAKPLSMRERARLAGIPQPQPGLKCPRCDSTNTKFCYFNNYSLTQLRYFCRACRRCWTRGGALRSVPVGSGNRRHANRFKPKAASTSTAAATAASASATLTPPSIACIATTQAALSSSGAPPILPPLLEYRLTDLDMANIAGFSFLSASGSSDAQGMEQQWMRAQLQMRRFPFLHALDQQMVPALVMPSMFGPGPPGLQFSGGGVNSGDGGREFYVTPMERSDPEGTVRTMNGDVIPITIPVALQNEDLADWAGKGHGTMKKIQKNFDDEEKRSSEHDRSWPVV